MTSRASQECNDAGFVTQHFSPSDWAPMTQKRHWILSRDPRGLMGRKTKGKEFLLSSSSYSWCPSVFRGVSFRLPRLSPDHLGSLKRRLGTSRLLVREVMRDDAYVTAVTLSWLGAGIQTVQSTIPCHKLNRQSWAINSSFLIHYYVTKCF